MSSPRHTLARTLAVVALGLACIWFSKLSLFVGVLVLISAAATLSRGGGGRLLVGLHVLAGVLTLIGLLRFVVTEAVPGVVAGGERAASKLAVSKLRGLVVAQDTMRRFAYVDPDGDGIGSAVWIPELGGDIPLRTGRPLTAALLNRELSGRIDTPLGPAAVGGAYLYIVCLPKLGGGFTAQPGTPVDEELAERRWVGYAWPAAEVHGVQEAYFIDEHETILAFDNDDGGQPIYSGETRPPACDAALRDDARWVPWQGKKPRQRLPGDTAAP
ncbi:MAG: hypothetical protein KIT72_00185 [Polyangiaceae bacterium]|nr:hypothetical protein [Polyangiaceae bacterium]MCW5788813.1 hypothetical protein [Polyangiaceae bacterium]